MRHLRAGLTRWASRWAYRTVVVLASWLRRHDSPTWRKLAVAGILSESPGMGEVIRLESETNYQMSREIGFPTEERRETARYIVPKLSSPRWAEEIQPFLANQLSAHTRRAYETDLKQFFQFLAGRVDLEDLGGLCSDHVILYRKFLEEGRLGGRPFEKSTINRKLAVIKSFFNWLKLNHLVPENPAQLVKGYPQTQESALKGLSDEETRRMLDQPAAHTRSGSLHRAILHSLFYLGLRKGELIALRMGDLDSERGIPVVKVRGKGHRVRVLPLPARVLESIERYLALCGRDRSSKEEPLFTPTRNPRTGRLVKPLNPNAVSYIVVRYARKVGVLKKVSPHSCRATCISNALDKRATHRSVQHLAGWSTPLMIQRYDKRREDLQNSAAFLVDYGATA